MDVLLQKVCRPERAAFGVRPCFYAVAGQTVDENNANHSKRERRNQDERRILHYRIFYLMAYLETVVTGC